MSTGLLQLRASRCREAAHALALRECGRNERGLNDRHSDTETDREGDLESTSALEGGRAADSMTTNAPCASLTAIFGTGTAIVFCKNALITGAAAIDLHELRRLNMVCSLLCRVVVASEWESCCRIA